MLILLLISLLATAIANPVIPNESKSIIGSQLDQATLGYAVDFTLPVNTSTLQCLKNNGITGVFVRVYSPAGQGTFDSNSISNIRNALKVNLTANIYITPNPKSIKSGATQLNETYNGLINVNINPGTMWLQVITPSLWHPNYINNIIFIQSYMDQLNNVIGIGGGIYTSHDDWNKITNNWTGAKNRNLKLWYSNVFGSGITGETAANYSDYVSFGGWDNYWSRDQVVAKQYGQTEVMCYINPLNKDVYSVGLFTNAGTTSSRQIA